jgi:peptidoglycan hydrolase-like protein with peptidoglycan-binding domain
VIALRSRRRVLVGGAFTAVAVAAAVIVALDVADGGSTSGSGSSDNATATRLATIRRQDLSSQTQVSATLGYARASAIAVPAGTAAADVRQAEQAAASARASVAQARATLSVDSRGPHPDSTKLDADRAALAAARTTLADAEAALAAARASEAAYGQSSSFTWLPAVGRVIRRGQALYAIDGRPALLLYGSVTPWRAFRAGMSAGRDVAQLNANLRALGYSAPTGSAFTSATAGAIEALQRAHGLPVTGELLVGSVAFARGAVRVTAVTPTRGAPVQAGKVLDASSTQRQVTIDLDASQQGSVKVGDPVTITLPDNTTTSGHVSSVGTVATAPSGDQGSGGDDQSPTITVHVRPDHPRATGRLDQAPVDVSITTETVRGVLVVPVSALVALAGGGYAVEEPTADGTHRLVPVRTGLFDDSAGLVEVSGSGLAAGRRVVVPA